MRWPDGVARQMPDRQLVLVTGKGGVGKTTLSAALARAASDAGKRTLAAEITSDVGTQSALLGIFGVGWAKGELPVNLGPRLDGVRITPAIGHKLFLRAALRVGLIADAAMRSAALNRFLNAAPAFPEIGTLYQLVWLLRLDRYDKIIVDLPATGHALGLAKLPRTVSRVVPRGLIKEAISEGLEVLTNPDRCAAVVASLPETLPVTESFELAAGLDQLSVPVAAMVLNQVPDNPFTEDELRALDEHVRSKRGELLLGTRELRRLERALVARKTFRDGVDGRVIAAELPVFRGGWPQIVEGVAGALVGAGLAAAPMAAEQSS